MSHKRNKPYKFELRWEARMTKRSRNTKASHLERLLQRIETHAVKDDGISQYVVMECENEIAYHSRVIEALEIDKNKKLKDQLYNPSERKDAYNWCKRRLEALVRDRVTER